MKTKPNIEWLLAIAIMIFLVVTLVEGFYSMQEVQSIINEKLITKVNTVVLLANDDLVSASFSLTNGSFFVIPSTNYTINYSLGEVNVTDSLYLGTNNVTYANYWFYPDSMLKSGIVRLILLLSILLILVLFITGLIKMKKIN